MIRRMRVAEGNDKGGAVNVRAGVVPTITLRALDGASGDSLSNALQKVGLNRDETLSPWQRAARSAR